MSLRGVDFARQQALFHLQEYARRFSKGEIPVPVPVEHIAEVYFGLRIERAELSSDTSGQLFVAERVIVLNSLDSITRQRFTTGHETGHFCLHTAPSGEARCPSSFSADKEREANYFAASLLLPTNLVLLKLAEEVNAAVKMAKSEGRVYELTSEDLDLIAQRLARTFVVSKTTMDILLSRRFVLKRPTQMGLQFGIETA